MIEYKIKESKENPKESIIEKTGHVEEFTLDQVELNTKNLEKVKKEVTAFISNRENVVSNIEQFHPFIKELEREKMNAVYMYYKALTELEEAKPKLEEINEALRSGAEEVEEIKKQINYVEPEVNVVKPDIQELVNEIVNSKEE